MTPEQLAEIELRTAAATRGPWVLMPALCGPEGQGVYHEDSGGCICEVGDPYPRGDNRPQPNMEFIAAAREDVPALCAALRDAWDMIACMRCDSDAYHRGRVDALREAALSLGRELASWDSSAPDGIWALERAVAAVEALAKEDVTDA